MAFSSNNIQKGIKRMPRKVVIYGPPKLGKSTLAGSTKNALLIPTEDRVAHIDCDKTPVLKSWEEKMEIFNFLLDEKNPHTYTRVVFDTIDWLEPLIHKAAIDNINSGKEKSKHAKSITDDFCKETAFSKGLKFHAVNQWKKFLHNCDILREHGIDVILIAHHQVVKVDPPVGDAYDKYAMKIDKHALAVIEEWADVIAFYDKNIFVTTEESGIGQKSGKAVANAANSRTLHLSGENPAMINGNSFGLTDSPVPLESCSEIMEWILTGPYDNNKTKKGDK